MSDLAINWLDKHYGEETTIVFEEIFLGALDEQDVARLRQLPEGLLGMVKMNGGEFVLAEGEIEIGGEAVRCLDLVLGPSGPPLNRIQRRYLEKLSQHISLYEVLEARPGSGLMLRDLLADDDSDPIWVFERGASQGLKQGAVLGARLIHGDPVKLSGCIYAFPVGRELDLLAQLRRSLADPPEGTTERMIRSGLVIDAWLYVLTAPPPTMFDQITEEPILFVTDHYKVRDWDTLVEALASEPDVDLNDEEWIWLQEFEDPAGDFVTRPALHLHPQDEDLLTASAMTQAKADMGRAWFESVAGEVVRWRSREVKSPAEQWEQQRAGAEELPMPAEPPAGFPEIPQQDIYEQVYKDWSEQPIPALGGLTPLQAVQTEAGLRSVKDVIESYERAELRKAPAAAAPAVNFDFLWRQLDLDRPH